jgi:CRP-like cAMP-binding protein
MDWNLILSAQTLRLASELQQSAPINGICVIKNARAKTYLKVTANQWAVLQQFGRGRTVPAVFDDAIRERICPRLGEFFELILKAFAAKILLEPGAEPPVVPATFPKVAVRPSWFFWPLWAVFLFGLGLAFAVRPEWPKSVLDILAGATVLSIALSIGALFAGLLLTGGGGDVGRPRWHWLVLLPYADVDTRDVIMQPLDSQYAVFLARTGTFAAIVGLTIWHEPTWSFLPLLGLMIHLRPIFAGKAPAMIRLACERGVSDAEHAFLFPPNWRPGERWRSLLRSLRQNSTWFIILYGAIWTLTIIYIGARFTDTPPWQLVFWQQHGIRIAMGVGGAVGAIAAIYLAWEFIRVVRERDRAQRETFRQWRSRWFGSRKPISDDAIKLHAISQSPLFGTLSLSLRHKLSLLAQEMRVSAWKTLPAEFGPQATKVGIIVRGKISLRRMVSPRKSRQAQVLTEGDVVGLHDLADPKVRYTMRSLTPVVLLVLDRAAAQEFLNKIERSAITDRILKVPFLRRIPLCQNWHLQAVERFAQLSTLTDFPEGSEIISEGEYVASFSVLFQGSAFVQQTKRNAKVRPGEFFGEIGLLQNSTANVTVLAGSETRCLRVARLDFMRFVTHNHTVALELERVSSERLGHPIFPLGQADFPEVELER